MTDSFKKADWRFGLLSLLLTPALAGCGDDSTARSGLPPPGTDAGLTAGGAFGAGGMVGSSGSSGTSGAGGATLGSGGMPPIGGMTGMDGGLDGSIPADGSTDSGQPDAPECVPGGPVDPSAFPECDLCANAHCVPNAAVPADTFEQLADCDAENKCVPDPLIETAGIFLFETCRSLDDAEGRCVSTCLPAVAERADYLPQDICEDGELCAPCFDPLTGEDSGACGVSCDPGPAEDPVVFEKCCGGSGSCVPSALVPENLTDSLGADTCSDDARLCAPDSFVDSTFQPATCRSLADAEGRCIPDCVEAVASQADQLPQDTCEDGELCAPCFDPTTGDSTGSCEINGDAPVEDPVVFDGCCGSLGVCVPTGLVPSDQQSLLDANTCTGAGNLCAPRDLVNPTFTPGVCSSVAGGEGRCLPACLPDVAVQADRLPQDICDDEYLCAPCFDPLTGLETGACGINGDEPQDPPTVFDSCCGGAGTCVPTSLVPASQQSLLGPDTCMDSGTLCAPTELTETTFIPSTCDSVGGFEGRCLPACLPDVAAQADRLPQDSCDSGELCAPCYDPIAGTDTGACTLNGDTPVEPPATFEDCCGGLGACVPPSLVPASQQDLLDSNTCSDNGDLCAPTNLAEPSFVPATCDSIGDFEGRCLPECLPDVAEQADRLPQDSCGQGELCAPCFDPITGENTGACDLNGDSPAGPPETFENCCGGIGSCVPPSLVPPAQQSLLSSDTCSDSGALCAPDKLTDSSQIPVTCDSIGGVEGRCLAACIPSVAARASQLPQAICDSGELCAPCYDPISGDPTGACDINGDAPVDPPVVFDTCCDQGGGTTLGRCIPASALSASQAGALPQETCPDDTWRCVPNAKVADPSAPLPTCSYGIASLQCNPPIFNLGCDGACLASCFLDSTQAGLLSQQECTGATTVCAPCVDPLSGDPTGACE